MNAKYDVLKAQQFVEELPVQSVVSWNSRIAGHVQHRQGKEALHCFYLMRSKGLSPNAVTYACILKACGITQETAMGEQIHGEIINQGLLEKDVVLGSALVDMYAKCGVFTKAQNVLDELPARNVVSWSALIAGYTQQGQGHEALGCFQRMRSEGFSPNAITYTSILKACGITQDIDMGKQIHEEIASRGLLTRDVILGNALVDMYAKCGILAKAQEALDELPILNVISWNGLIAGYVQHGHGKEALGCFHRMRCEGLSPNGITYSCILKACGITQESDVGEKMHGEIISRGLLENDVLLGSALVDMYAKCGVLTKAHKVLDELRVRDVVSWSTLIAGYAQQGKGQEALESFRRMQSEGFSPDALTFACILMACGIMEDVEMGKRIHEDIANQGLLENVVLGNALVDMYVKFGALTEARNVFDELPVHDDVSWNVLIAGYVEQRQGLEALSCFHKMRSGGFSPNTITYACILKACALVQEVNMGQQIHDEIASQGLLGKDAALGNALVDMYAKCGLFTNARIVLDELSVRDEVSWNALIAGYTQHRKGEEALGCFHQMRSEGFFPDAITYACILKACGILQEVKRGKQIHDEISRHGLLGKDVILCNALVNMYAKCGVLLKAQKVLDELPLRNVISWNSLIAGYARQGQCKEALGCFQRMRSECLSPNVVSWNALIIGYVQHGEGKEALDCFQWMQQEGICPDAITFVNVLIACSQLGLVDEGHLYFDNMRETYGVTPNKEHYACMVDLFGRARLFDKAMRVICMMPSPDYPPVWFALLSACRKWGNVKLGKMAFQRIVQLHGCNAAVYV